MIRARPSCPLAGPIAMAEVVSENRGAIARVVISNPAKHNAMTPEMWAALDAALDAAAADASVRAIVIEGAGEKAFVSGADIGRLDPKPSGDGRPTLPYMAPLGCAKPVIAKIRGYCMGGGLGLAAACDLRIAADDAIFRMPAARLGMGYAYDGVRRFVEVIGAANTLDIFFSARRFDAAEALRLGFLSRVVPAADLDRVVDEYCALIGENAPLTLAAAKKSVLAILGGSAAADVAAAQKLIDRALTSDDLKEGRAAFMEKRTPRWQGR